MQAAWLSHAYLLGGRLQDASTLAGRALALARAHRNGAMKRMPCTSSETSRRGASPRSPKQSKPTTTKPSP